jgi:hypothetical protein
LAQAPVQVEVLGAGGNLSPADRGLVVANGGGEIEEPSLRGWALDARPLLLRVFPFDDPDWAHHLVPFCGGADPWVGRCACDCYEERIYERPLKAV